MGRSKECRTRPSSSLKHTPTAAFFLETLTAHRSWPRSGLLGPALGAEMPLHGGGGLCWHVSCNGDHQTASSPLHPRRDLTLTQGIKP